MLAHVHYCAGDAGASPGTAVPEAGSYNSQQQCWWGGISLAGDMGMRPRGGNVCMGKQMGWMGMLGVDGVAGVQRCPFFGGAKSAEEADAEIRGGVAWSAA